MKMKCTILSLALLLCGAQQMNAVTAQQLQNKMMDFGPSELVQHDMLPSLQNLKKMLEYYGEEVPECLTNMITRLESGETDVSMLDWMRHKKCMRTLAPKLKRHRNKNNNTRDMIHRALNTDNQLTQRKGIIRTHETGHCTTKELIMSIDETLKKQAHNPICVNPAELDLTQPFVISQPGYYVLTDNMIVTPGNTGSLQCSIQISSDNVILDLNTKTLTQGNSEPDVVGICVDQDLSNVTIKNGTVDQFSTLGIGVHEGCCVVTIEDMTVKRCKDACIHVTGADPEGPGNAVTILPIGDIFNPVREITIKNCLATESSSMGNSFFIFVLNCEGLRIENTDSTNHTAAAAAGGIVTRGINNFLIENCHVSNMQGDPLNFSSAYGFSTRQCSNGVFRNCSASQLSSLFLSVGLFSRDDNNLLIEDCPMTDFKANLVSLGFVLEGRSAGSENVLYRRCNATDIQGINDIGAFGGLSTASAFNITNQGFPVRNCVVDSFLAGNVLGSAFLGDIEGTTFFGPRGIHLEDAEQCSVINCEVRDIRGTVDFPNAPDAGPSTGILSTTNTGIDDTDENNIIFTPGNSLNIIKNNTISNVVGPNLDNVPAIVSGTVTIKTAGITVKSVGHLFFGDAAFDHEVTDCIINNVGFANGTETNRNQNYFVNYVDNNKALPVRSGNIGMLGALNINSMNLPTNYDNIEFLVDLN